jgi:yjeF C-terminal region, hydroxyethylthiazole kinase-related/yjeF N-terminal region
MQRKAMAIDRHTLLTPAAVAAVDRRAIESGIDGPGLMRRAGASVAAAALAHFPDARRAIILCGPGNNGGDGHVVARLLDASGIPTFRFGFSPKSGTDAAGAFADFPGLLPPLPAYTPEPGDLVVDALFGAGLDRPVEAEVADVIARIEEAGVPVLAVDLPSGLSGLTGRPTGAVFRATRTVTFAALKPGHLLMPGRELCGEVEIADIGVPARMIASDDPLWRNHPRLFDAALPRPGPDAHKYARGHLVVFSGPLISGGAARLAATAGLHAGAGLVTLATPAAAIMAQATHLTAVMQRRIDNVDDLAGWLEDPRLSAFVIGPGFGSSDTCRAFVQAIASSGRPAVLDADAVTAFAGEAGTLGRMFSGDCRLVVTPHEGEFRRLLPDLAADDTVSKVDRARRAAAALNGVVVYKGPDTVIAAPDGRAAINADAPPWLATAGSGDVLAGMIGGLVAQRMPVFEAALAGVALHGKAGHLAGPGSSAEDIVARVGAAVSDATAPTG